MRSNEVLNSLLSSQKDGLIRRRKLFFDIERIWMTVMPLVSFEKNWREVPYCREGLNIPCFF